MRRKILQHYADVLCHMVVGWRMAEDLEILSDLPSGKIHLDILKGTATHDQLGSLSLHISEEMKAWIYDRIEKDRIPPEGLKSVVLEVEMNTDRIKTDKKRIISFHWTCKSIVATDEKTYSVELNDKHIWHSRLTNKNANKAG